MNGPIKRDQPENIAIPERPPSKRQLDLVPFRWVLRLGLRGWGKGQPGIAPQAPVPTEPSSLTSKERVLLSQCPCLGAKEFVTMDAAPDQLVT